MAAPHCSKGRIRRSADANWSALYDEGCRGRHGAAVGIELAHLLGDVEHLPVQLLRVCGVHLFRKQTKHGVAGSVPRRIAGASPSVTVFLAPTVFGRA